MKSIFTRTLLLTLLLFAVHGFCQAQTVRYVDSSVAVPGNGSSWATAFNDFQAAINASGVNDTVLVAKGTYQRGSGSYFDIGYYDYSFQKAGLKIFGGFPSGGSSFAQRNVLNNPTVLKGNNGPVVTMGAKGNTEFDGFTIRDGVATAFNPDLPYVAAGGIVIGYVGGYVSANRIIKNCTFINNSGNLGGAVFFNASQDEGTATSFANCLFIGNTATKGGAIYHNNYSIKLFNCSFYHNTSILPSSSKSIWSASFNGGIAAFNCIFDNQVYTDHSIIGTWDIYLEKCIYPDTYLLGGSNINNFSSYDPTFIFPKYVDPANGNFHLQCSSGANNNGNNAAVPAYLTKDLAGNDRIRRGTVDMGVFEEIGGNQYTNFYDTICQGTPYVYKGQTLTQTGAYSNTYSTYYGCDSIVTLYLTVRPVTSSEVTVITCGGYTANGNTYTTPGTYVSHTTNRYGCDSTITVHLLRIIPSSNTLYVDSSVAVNGDGSSWANAFKSLSDALLAAKYCNAVDSIFVAQGTYQPPSGQSFIMAKGVKILGGFPSGGGSFAQRTIPISFGTLNNCSILKGNGADVVHNENNLLTQNDVLDGFIIQNGLGYNEYYDKGMAGGITNINASPSITHCAFLNNVTESLTGGGAIYNKRSAPYISQCIFYGNIATDVFGGMYFGAGGAIYAEDSSVLTVNNCLFVGNIACPPDVYGYYYGQGYGGAIYSTTGLASITNCVFTLNTSPDYPVVYFSNSTQTKISNCILYNNIDPNGNNWNISNDTQGGTVANNNIIGAGDNSGINQPYAGVIGTGNIFNTDPLFVNAGNNDYRLQPNSPAIDAGTADTTGLKIGNKDAVGRNRIMGNRIDIGAYELPAYYSTGSNAANTLTNWKTNKDGTGTSPLAFNNLARFTVRSGHTVSIAGNLGLDSSALFIQTNAVINNTGMLSIGSLLSNNGSITGTGTTVLNGTMGNQVLDSTGGISNLTINNNATITATGKQTVTGVLTLKSGTFTTNGNLVLASTASGTASLAAIDGTVNTGSLAGAVTAQRYLAAQRAYRLLGHPFSGNIALSNLQPYVDVTGTGSGLTAGNASAFNYLTGIWKPYLNNTDTWNSKEALLLFVRGTVGQGIGVISGGYTPNAPTLQYKGIVNTGSLSYTVKSATAFGGTATGWNAIANPYPAAIDVNSIGNIAAVGGSGASIYVWNAGKASLGAGLASGGYDFYTLGSPIVLPSWGAFFIKNTSGTNQTIQFNESNKAVTAPLNLLRTNNVKEGFLLEVDDALSGAYWDKLKISFNNTSSANYTDQEDLEKISNTNLDLYSIASDRSKLAVNALPALQSTNDAIPLGIATNEKRGFILKANNVNLPANALYYLHDRYKEEWVSITDTMSYAFTVNSDTASKGNNRFEIVMKPAPPVIVPSTMNVDRLTVKVTPNPILAGAIKVTYASPEAMSITIRVVDALGKTIYSTHEGTQQAGTTYIPATTWRSGVYMVQVSNGKESITQQVVKQ